MDTDAKGNLNIQKSSLYCHIRSEQKVSELGNSILVNVNNISE